MTRGDFVRVARRCGLSRQLLYKRVAVLGWSLRRATRTPVRRWLRVE